MNITKGQKIYRTLTFLSGVMSPEASRQLRPYGFDQAEADKGRELCEATRVLMLAPVPRDPRMVVREKVDIWENTWLRIADIVLAQHYPEVHAFVFAKVSRTDGLAVYLSVGEFVSRIRKLETGREVPDGQAARAVLAGRGLTEAVLSEGERLLDEAFSIPNDPPERRSKALAEAEDAMWSWYLEWGGIARVAIHNRVQLRKLGFLRSRSASRPDDVTDAEVFGDDGAPAGDDMEGEATLPDETPAAEAPPEASSPAASDRPVEAAEGDEVAA